MFFSLWIHSHDDLSLCTWRKHFTALFTALHPIASVITLPLWGSLLSKVRVTCNTRLVNRITKKIKWCTQHRPWCTQHRRWRREAEHHGILSCCPQQHATSHFLVLCFWSLPCGIFTLWCTLGNRNYREGHRIHPQDCTVCLRFFPSLVADWRFTEVKRHSLVCAHTSGQVILSTCCMEALWELGTSGCGISVW